MAKRGIDKPPKRYLILEEYLQNAYHPLDRIESEIEEHLNGRQFELGKPITVTLIPVTGSAFYLLERVVVEKEYHWQKCNCGGNRVLVDDLDFESICESCGTPYLKPMSTEG